MSLSMSQSRIISIPSRTSHTPQRSAWLIVRLTARPHRTRSDHISQYCNGARETWERIRNVLSHSPSHSQTTSESVIIPVLNDSKLEPRTSSSR